MNWILIFLAFLMAFCLGGYFACNLILKAVNESLANPDGRWARSFEWLEKHYRKPALGEPLTSTLGNEDKTSSVEPLGKGGAT